MPFSLPEDIGPRYGLSLSQYPPPPLPNDKGILGSTSEIDIENNNNNNIENNNNNNNSNFYYIQVTYPNQKLLVTKMKDYQQYKLNLLEISFDTVVEYILLLRAFSMVLSSRGSRVLLYLAAAVSDFYVRYSKMSEHKIQSRETLTSSYNTINSIKDVGEPGSIQLTLDQTPKVLRKVKEEWAKEAFLVTFKLETDKNLLWKKMVAAFETIHMDLQVGNILASSKTNVFLWNTSSSSYRESNKFVPVAKDKLSNINEGDPSLLTNAWMDNVGVDKIDTGVEESVEFKLVKKVTHYHQSFILSKEKI